MEDIFPLFMCMHVHQCACVYVCHLPTLSQAVSLLLGGKSLPRMKAVGETSGNIPSSSETDADPVSLCVLVLQVRSGVISVRFHNHFNRHTVMVWDVLGPGVQNWEMMITFSGAGLAEEPGAK